MSLFRSLPAFAAALAVAWFTPFAARAGPAAQAQPEEKGWVHATLLADTSAVRPGEPFMLGVRLEIQPGWHVYWLNPGDSGRPTRVKLSGPAGFTVGDLRYPVPEKFQQSDGAVAYGYTGTVLLTARVTPPDQAKDLPAPGAPAAFSSDVSWLCCQDLCLPGKARCELEVPMAAAPAGGAPAGVATANAALFAEWERRVPVPAGEPGAPATASFTAEPSEKGAVFSVIVHWATPPAQVEFFPAPQDALKLSDVTVADDRAGATRIRFTLEVLKGQKLTGSDLAVVVAGREDKGAWRGVSVRLPLEQSGVR